MSTKDFLIQKLTLMSQIFPDIKIRYEHRILTQSHIVEVIPLAVFKQNDEYLNAEIQLEEEFESLFPNETIVFISEDSLTEIYNPDLRLGYDFISFEIPDWQNELIFSGVIANVEINKCENYALAA